jgi:hypothetical protein
VTAPDLSFSFQDLIRRWAFAVVKDSGAEDHAPELVAVIMHYVERPARFIRPRLVVAAARAYGAQEFDEDSPVVLLAVATELLHMFALLHDDRIDTPCREGSFSSGTALLAGDLLYAAGYGLIAETVEQHHLSRHILTEVRRIASRTVVGQSADVRFRHVHADHPSRADLYRLYDLKTGLYTVAAPLQIGALAAGCDPAEAASLAEVALPLGRAFQLQDDFKDIVEVRDRILNGDGSSAERDRSFRSVPPWELNLAVTYAADSRQAEARQAEASQAEVHQRQLRDDSAFLRSLDMGELKRFVSTETQRFVRDAIRHMAHLQLSPEQRLRFRREVEGALVTLTFPSDKANTSSDTYGTE